MLVTTLVVLQPGYLPWLGYFDLLQKADVFVHYDDVQFDKHGWRNRNRVKGPKGAIWLTVPVLHRGRAGQPILDVEIDNRQDWRRNICRPSANRTRAHRSSTPCYRSCKTSSSGHGLASSTLTSRSPIGSPRRSELPRRVTARPSLTSAAIATSDSSTFAINSAQRGISRATLRRTISTWRNLQPPASRSSGTIMSIPDMRSSTGSSFPICRWWTFF